MSLRDELPELTPEQISKPKPGSVAAWHTVKDMAAEEGVTPQGILHRIRAGKYDAGIFLGGIMVRRYKPTKK